MGMKAKRKAKDWFDRELAQLLANKIVAVQPKFDSKKFVASVSAAVKSLELTDRVELISDALFEGWERDYLAGLQTLLKILGPENPSETGMFSEFYWVLPLAKYVEKYGLEEPRASLAAIGAITKRNTGEYAVRPYLIEHTELTLKTLKKWSAAKNFHLHRLASEGVRPRLPWARKIDMFVERPQLALSILEDLKDDPVRFVQKSVANCLADIYKDNPEVAQATLEGWATSGLSDARRWILRHAIRKPLADGEEWAARFAKKVEKAVGTG